MNNEFLNLIQNRVNVDELCQLEKTVFHSQTPARQIPYSCKTSLLMFIYYINYCETV